MSTISTWDIERDPLAFLRRIEAGEPLLVVRDDHPVAEVRPLPNGTAGPRPYGLAAGRFAVPADFNDPLPEDILRQFEGR